MQMRGASPIGRRRLPGHDEQKALRLGAWQALGRQANGRGVWGLIPGPGKTGVRALAERALSGRGVWVLIPGPGKTGVRALAVRALSGRPGVDGERRERRCGRHRRLRVHAR